MKIQRVHIRNFRNIEDIEKEINGANLLLVGENTIGKSNFIKALETALGMTSHATLDPIMHGKDEAFIEVVLGENGKEYTFDVKFSKDREKPVITVTTPDGVSTKAKSTIGSIVGEIDFDIDEFLKMSESEKGRKQQVEIVKSFLDPEIISQLNEYEQQVQSWYNDRTEINRKIKTIEGFLEKSLVDDHTAMLYSETIDTSEIQEKLNNAVKRAEHIAQANEKIKNHKTAIEEKKALIAKLQAEVDEHEKSLITGANWLKTNPAFDKDAIMNELNHANTHNAKCKDVESYRTMKKELEAEKEHSENLTIKIETVRQNIADTIREIETPVKGLTFNEEQLMYNDKPVSRETLSTAEIMMLGAKLKIAKNPNANVLFIQRGESLGLEKLRELQKMANDYGFQIIMEQMERGIEKLQIEFMPKF